MWANRLRLSPRPSPDACRFCFDASACIRMETMKASDMARRRWKNVSPEERSRLTRSAALARWASAGESEFIKARSRAATAREVRTRQCIRYLRSPVASSTRLSYLETYRRKSVTSAVFSRGCPSVLNRSAFNGSRDAPRRSSQHRTHLRPGHSSNRPYCMA
jgi:hypothetical protein